MKVYGMSTKMKERFLSLFFVWNQLEVGKILTLMVYLCYNKFVIAVKMKADTNCFSEKNALAGSI